MVRRIQASHPPLERLQQAIDALAAYGKAVDAAAKSFRRTTLHHRQMVQEILPILLRGDDAAALAEFAQQGRSWSSAAYDHLEDALEALVRERQSDERMHLRQLAAAQDAQRRARAELKHLDDAIEAAEDLVQSRQHLLVEARRRGQVARFRLAEREDSLLRFLAGTSAQRDDVISTEMEISRATEELARAQTAEHAARAHLRHEETAGALSGHHAAVREHESRYETTAAANEDAQSRIRSIVGMPHSRAVQNLRKDFENSIRKLKREVKVHRHLAAKLEGVVDESTVDDWLLRSRQLRKTARDLLRGKSTDASNRVLKEPEKLIDYLLEGQARDNHAREQARNRERARLAEAVERAARRRGGRRRADQPPVVSRGQNSVSGRPDLNALRDQFRRRR